MYDTYCNRFLEDQRMGATTFYEVASQATAHDEKLMTTVNYVIGTLVNDPIRTLEHIVDDFCIGNTRKLFVTNIAEVKTFLKVHYDNHLLLNDGCPTHSIGYALGPNYNGPQLNKSCCACKFTEFYVQPIG